MAEYIERNRVLDVIRRTSGDYAAAFSEITRIPAADVAPVRHGRWVLKEISKGIEAYDCSECEFELPLNPIYFPEFCEECGAIMDAEG